MGPMRSSRPSAMSFFVISMQVTSAAISVDPYKFSIRLPLGAASKNVRTSSIGSAWKVMRPKVRGYGCQIRESEKRRSESEKKKNTMREDVCAEKKKKEKIYIRKKKEKKKK